MSSELYSTPQQPPSQSSLQKDRSLVYISSPAAAYTYIYIHVYRDEYTGYLPFLQWTWTGLDNNNVNDGRNRTRSSGKSIGSVDERANRIDSRTLHKTRYPSELLCSWRAGFIYMYYN